MDSADLAKILIALLTLIIGGVIGFFSSRYLEIEKKGQALTAKLLEHFLKAYEEIADLLSDIADLRMDPGYDADQLAVWEKEVSKQFYKHYSLLPPEVLLEMNCLYMCLAAKGRRLFTIKNGKRITALDMGDRDAIRSFIRGVSLVENIEDIANLYPKLSPSQAVNFQARRVLRKTNDVFKYSRIFDYGTKLKKYSLGETE